MIPFRRHQQLGRSFVPLAVLACGCASPPGATSTPVAVATPTSPPVSAGPEADAAPEDATVPSAQPEPERDAGSRPNPLLAGRDAGPPGDADSLELSPIVRAGGAIVTKRPPFEERQIVLLDGPPTLASCSLRQGDPEIVMSACHTEQGHTCVAQIVSIRAGVTTRYRIRITVLQLPKKKGARGRIQLEESEDTNVHAIHGGVVDVIVCD